MGLFDWFKKRTCAEYLDDLEGLLLVIAKYPEKAVDEPRTLAEAKAIAARCAKLLGKVDHLDKTTADALRGKLYFIESPSNYTAMRAQAQVAIEYVLQLKKFCTGKMIRKQEAEAQLSFKRGEMKTYVRLMGKEELACISSENTLSCEGTAAPVAAFLAPPKQEKFFSALKKSKVRDLSQLMNSKTPDFVVTFKTDVEPLTVTNSPYERIFSVKLPHGAPIRIVKTRRV